MSPFGKTKLHLVVAAATALPLLISGCGGGGSGGDSPTVPPPPPPPPPPPLFSESVALPDLPGTSFVYVQEAIDLDFNGAPDIVLSGPIWRSGFVDESVALHVYMNSSTLGSPSFSYSTLTGDLAHPRAAVQADLNGDGVPDLAIADHGFDLPPRPGHADLLLLSDSAGTLQATSSQPFEHMGFSHDIASGDIDNDGDVDLVVADLTAPTGEIIRILTNDGTGQFFLSFPSQVIQDGSYTSLVIADVNVDGNSDLVLGAIDSSTTSAIMLGDGSGDFAAPIPLPGNPAFAIVPDILATDVNADSYVDLVLSRTSDNPFYEGRLIQFLINDGAGNFVDTPLIPGQETSDKWTTEIYFVDIDGDNLKDIVLRSDNSMPSQNIFLQQTDGTFAPFELPISGGVFPVDVDNDGDLDLLVHSDKEESSSVQLLINNSEAQ